MDSERIAIFPLSNVVLFPEVNTPLHLFEPRYRQMASEVLAGNGMIGMVVVPPEHAGDLSGNPPVYPIGCAGPIVRNQKLPDGRFNIVVAGEFRFRILHEVEGPAERLYRVAEIERLEDPLHEVDRGEVERLRGIIDEQVRTLVGHSDADQAEQLGSEILPGAGPATFVNTLSNALAFSPAEKQGLLEAADIRQRFERLEGLLAFRLAASSGPAGGPQTLH